MIVWEMEIGDVSGSKYGASQKSRKHPMLQWVADVTSCGVFRAGQERLAPQSTTYTPVQKPPWTVYEHILAPLLPEMYLYARQVRARARLEAGNHLSQFNFNYVRGPRKKVRLTTATLKQ